MPTHKRYEFSVTISPSFVADQSDVDLNRFVFSYTVIITNIGSVPAQVVSRHWVITDANNNVQEVRGLGVIGLQPLLRPGEHFEYTSSVLVHTPVATMQGSYQLAAEDGTQFDTVIEPFTLSMPRVLH
jgi:ApaG protein